MTFFENALSETELIRLGENLAMWEKVVKRRGKIPDYSREIHSISQIIESTCQQIISQKHIFPGEEWIRDNQFFTEIKIQELKKLFQDAKNVGLPLVRDDGRLIPRVAVLARELTNHSQGLVTYGKLKSFLGGYSKISGLSTDELYMLKPFLMLSVFRRIATACMILSGQREEHRLAIKVYEMLKQHLETGKRSKALEMWISKENDLTPGFCVALLRQAAEENEDTEEYRKILEKKLCGRHTSLDQLSEQQYRLQIALGSGMGNAITSLNGVPAFNWREIVETESAVINILKEDPSGIFQKMNSKSKMSYVRAIEFEAHRERISPEALARKILEKTVDLGEKAHIGQFVKVKRSDFSNLFIALCAVTTVALGFAPAVALFMSKVGIFLIPPLFILCRNIAVQLMQGLFYWTGLRPQTLLPGMDFSKGIPEKSKVMIVMPVLLMNGNHVKKAFSQLEAIYCGNIDENVFCTLTGDLCDSDTKDRDMDSEIRRVGIKCAEDLNKKYGEKFFFRCRERCWSETQQKWICKDRKRGALIEFNKEIAGKYALVLTVDDGTIVPPGAVCKMAEIMAHPLNKEYGILQPEIGTVPFEGYVSRYSEIFSPEQGRWAYGAQGGFYFNLSGQGSYTGKGMYRPVRFNKICENLFPEEKILSHDLIEGCFLGCAQTGEVSLFETFPEEMEQDIKRQHRWTRGDWQLLPYLKRYFTDKNGRKRKNTLSPLCKFKIRDNLVRSLFPGSLVFFFIGSLFVPSALWYSMAVVFLSVFVKFLVSPSVKSLRQSVASAFLAPYMGYIMTDAVVRALWRLYVSQKNLLEWTTAAQAALKISRGDRPSPVKISAVHKQAYLREARRIWAFYEDFVTENDNFLPPDNVQFEPVYAVAHRTSPTNIGYYLLACLEAYRLGFISLATLVQRVEKTLETVGKMPKFRGHLFNWYDTISLTVLNPKFVSSVDSGNFAACLITLKEGIKNIRADENYMDPVGAQVTKELMGENSELWQPKYRQALAEIDSKFYSGDRPLRKITETIEKLLKEMDFSFLMDSDRMLLYTGFDVGNNAPTNSFYDMAASEARLTSYVAIAKGDLPAEHFDRPLRKFGKDGRGVLKSWSGTGFEFYMPELFFKNWPGSLWDTTVKLVTGAQVEYGRKKGIPWGISESGYNSKDVDLNYKYKAFGVPGLGMKPEENYPPVISPYTSMMVADRYPAKVFYNLNHLKKEGASGIYGFHEAVDFTRDRAGVVKSYMAHHMGMALTGITNLLASGYVREMFNSDPGISECEILLAETAPEGYENAKIEKVKSVKSSALAEKEIKESITSRSVPISNGKYLCVASVDGKSESFFQEKEMTVDGLQVFVREKSENLFFSVGKMPLCGKPESYFTEITPYSCSIMRKDGPLVTEMKLFVAPDDNAEIRHLKITNTGQVPLKPEISVKCRPALNYRDAWKDHQTYSELFITSQQPSPGVTLFRHRRTGLESFLVQTGIRSVPVNPGEVHEEYVVFGVGNNYKKYISFDNCASAERLISVLGKVEKELLNIDDNLLNSFINLTGHIIENREGVKYGDGFYRHKDVGEELKKWGASGKKPVVAVFVNRMEQIGFLQKMVKFREFCRFRQFPVDVVFAAPLEMEDMIRRETGEYFTGEKDCLAACASLIVKPGAGNELPGKENAYRDIVSRPVLKWELTPKPEFKSALIANLDFFNGFGGFKNKGKEYVILGGTPTPAPWINCVSNEKFGFTVSETGCGTVWNINSKENRLTPWNCDVENQIPQEEIYISRRDSEEYFTPTPGGLGNNHVVIHGLGKTTYILKTGELETELTVFTPLNSPVKYSVLTINNLTGKNMELDLVYRVKLAPPPKPYQIICSKEDDSVLFNCFRMSPFGAMTTFMGCSSGIVSFSCDENECYPGAKNFSSKEGVSRGCCGAIHTRITDRGQTSASRTSVVFVLGQTFEDSTRHDILQKAVYPDKIMAELNSVDNFWSGITDLIQVETPDKALNFMVNSRLLYQVISCRLWGRTAFYQSGGAIGFRDQLQDSLALILTKPEMVREQILLHAAHQFKEGDVQHWWHPPKGDGVRTRCSDDLLWLPYAVYEYVKSTGDKSILDEKVSYLESPLLEPGQQDRYETPLISNLSESVFDHCIRAVEHSLKFGDHGLPLIGSCDWNDGMSSVGDEGKGESVWLAWFMCVVLDRMAELSKITGKSGKKYRELASRISASVEKQAWEGDHYLRAFYDSGEPMKVIDAISQAWAVISGHCIKERGKMALSTAEEALVDRENGLIRLLTPSFNDENTKTDHPGYIAFYPEGIRENGAQYTHGALWFIKALFMAGEKDKAYDLLSMINPINHSLTGADATRYKVEPYAVAADIYSVGALAGHGGWSWYTGSAAWMYRVITEDLLGICLENGKLTLKPNLPSGWRSYRLKGVIGGKKTDIVVKE